MRIRIEGVRTNPDGVVWVDFSTPWGRSEARWRGPEAIVGDEHLVEIEIEEPLIWGGSIRNIDEQPAKLWSDGARTSIVGRLETVDDDGVVFVRLDPSALLMIETHGEPCSKGSAVLLVAESITLFSHTCLRRDV